MATILKAADGRYRAPGLGGSRTAHLQLTDEHFRFRYGNKSVQVKLSDIEEVGIRRATLTYPFWAYVLFFPLTTLLKPVGWFRRWLSVKTWEEEHLFQNLRDLESWLEAIDEARSQ